MDEKGLLQEALVKLRDVQGKQAPKSYACNLIRRIERVIAPQVVGYCSGECRNSVAEGVRSTTHTYADMSDGSLVPMCGYGWNRSDGEAFSIFRGSPGTEGDCKLCRKNVAAGRQPVFDGFPHKTRWL